MDEKEKLAQMLDIKGQYKGLNKRIEYIESLDKTAIPSKEEDLGYWLNVRKELIEVAKILNIDLTQQP
jgi:hypothetical protein